MKPEWEVVTKDLVRMRVPSGWIVKQSDQRENPHSGAWNWEVVATFFVPDCAFGKHHWLLTEEPKEEGQVV